MLYLRKKECVLLVILLAMFAFQVPTEAGLKRDGMFLYFVCWFQQL